MFQSLEKSAVDVSNAWMAGVRDRRAGRDEQPVPYRGNLATTDEQLENGLKEEFCRPLAVTFQVSPEAMRIRLEELKLLVPKKDATLF